MNNPPSLEIHFTDAEPPLVAGLRVLTNMAWNAQDFGPLIAYLKGRLDDNPDDAAALIDLSVIEHLRGRPAMRLDFQSRALTHQRVFRNMSSIKATCPLRLLAFMAPGDFMANTPVEFLLENTSVNLDIVYVSAEGPLPAEFPDHDIAIVAVAESAPNRPILARLASLVAAWPRPVLNDPSRVARLTRDGTAALLAGAAGVAMPINLRASRAELESLAADVDCRAARLEAIAYPMIVRPLDSHAGEGLSLVSTSAELADYLASAAHDQFYIANFVDYRNDDGLYRKYRVALIDGRPYASHLAISRHWMVHYLNADMINSTQNRAEEARFMETFDQGFAERHAAAFAAIDERIGLEYLPMDCAETRDGRLLVFEVGTNMIVHGMDSAELFPYKQRQMAKVFAAFENMLAARRKTVRAAA